MAGTLGAAAGGVAAVELVGFQAATEHHTDQAPQRTPAVVVEHEEHSVVAKEGQGGAIVAGTPGAAAGR